MKSYIFLGLLTITFVSLDAVNSREERCRRLIIRAKIEQFDQKVLQSDQPRKFSLPFTLPENSVQQSDANAVKAQGSLLNHNSFAYNESCISTR